MDSLVQANKLISVLQKGHQKPNIVILGAGFSKSFGLPLANELLEKVTAVRFNMTNPPKKVVKYQEAAVNSLDSKFL